MSRAAERIEAILRREFQPLHFALRDDSARHAGHPGATSGGGHFHVTLVSATFEGLTRLQQHQRVNDALRDLFGPEIHALALTTRSPAEWESD